MKDTVINEKNVKIPLYVAAYETISQWLKDGKYKAGDKLPGENILAEQLQVSRGTLRQAMLLLQEDGLIINHQGKGNIVLSNQDMSKSGLERIGNPIVDFCSEPVDRVLKLRPSSVVAVIDITYYSGDTPAGFAMVYMPHEVLDNSNVDLEDTDTVYRYYTELLETSGLYSDTKIRLGQARERLANILCIQEGDPLLLLEEVLYTEYDTPVLSQKLFFGPDQHELSIRRKNDRNMMKKSE